MKQPRPSSIVGGGYEFVGGQSVTDADSSVRLCNLVQTLAAENVAVVAFKCSTPELL